MTAAVLKFLRLKDETLMMQIFDFDPVGESEIGKGADKALVICRA